MNHLRREPSCAEASCIQVHRSIVCRVSSFISDIEVLIWIHVIVMMFSMLYIVLYILYGYLDWYFKDYVTLYLSVVLVLYAISVISAGGSCVYLVLLNYVFYVTEWPKVGKL